MSFNGFVVSDDFCKAFRGLGNRISYVYKHGLKPGKYEISTFHVIVDGMYWDFLFKPETHLTKFYDQESLLAPVFTDQYIGATCLWIGGDKEKCDTLLFPKGETISKVIVTRVTNDNHENAKYLNEFPKPEEWTVSGLPQQKYAFVHDSGLYDNRMDFAIGSTPGKQFSRLYYKFEDRNGEKSFAAIKTSDKDTDMTKNFDMDMEVIGIWYQWSNKEKSFGHIVFMRDNLKVFWCWKKISDNKVSETKITITYCLTNCFSAKAYHWLTALTPTLLKVQILTKDPVFGFI